MPQGAGLHAAHDDGWLVGAVREVWGLIPAQVVRDGARVNWGPEGTKARSVYLAALMWHHFDAGCTSCESDLYYVIRNAAMAK